MLNIGTLDPYWVENMKLALTAAAQRGISTVLDTAAVIYYRNKTLGALLAVALPTVTRNNGSEIMNTAGVSIKTRGVVRTASSLLDEIQLLEQSIFECRLKPESAN